MTDQANLPLLSSTANDYNEDQEYMILRDPSSSMNKNNMNILLKED